MRRLGGALLFVLFFLLSLYLTFPFERIALGVLQEEGIYPKELTFHHFPPEFTAKEVSLNGIKIENIVFKPSLSFKNFKVFGNLCSGKFEVGFNRKLTNANFHLEGVKLDRCPLNSDVKVKGNLNGSGNLLFEKGLLRGGRGTFNLSGLNLENLNLGLISYKFLNLGSGDINYRVSGKNYLKVFGELSGKDADVSVNGGISVNLRNLNKSYLSFRVSVKLKTGNLKGRRFNFRVQGNPNSLRFF
jgi:hypothetical protein